MRDILILGAGGFGREIQWLIERINQQNPTWRILGYLDDGVEPGTEINGYKVLGNIGTLNNYDKHISVVCAIGSSKVREDVVTRIKQLGEYQFPNLIDPNAQNSQFLSMGEGNIVCAGNILTVNIEMEDFVILNLSCTIGHDVNLKSFVTVYPGVNISGCTLLKKGVELGTGSKIIQGRIVGENTIVGAGAVVVRDLPPDCTAMGIPAKPVKFFGGGYKTLLIVGASGHGEVIFDLARKIGIYQEIYFLDDDESVAESNGLVIGVSDFPLDKIGRYDVIVATGDSAIRRRIQEKYARYNIRPVSLVHPEAVLPEETIQIGEGTVIMAGAVIQAGVKIGRGVILNTSSSVDHECEIGDFSHISVGTHLAGNVEIGSNTWVGIGAIINNNVRICENVVIGAGAVVIKDILESGTYAGVPAKRIN